MNYKLDENGYLDGFIIGGKIPNGIDYDGEIPTDILENMKAYKIVNNKLILDEEKLKELQENYECEKEIVETEEWLDEYDKKVASYNRCVRLGIKTPYDIDIDSLDNEAREKHNKLDKNKERLRKKRK